MKGSDQLAVKIKSFVQKERGKKEQGGLKGKESEEYFASFFLCCFARKEIGRGIKRWGACKIDKKKNVREKISHAAIKARICFVNEKEVKKQF